MTKMLVAIGDLHGRYDALREIINALHESHEILEEPHGFYEAGNCIREGMRLVFTGDYIDRGPNGKRILEWLRASSERSGDRLVALVGNHELFALEALDAFRDGIPEGISEVKRLFHNTGHGRNGGKRFVEEFLEDYPDFTIEDARAYLAQMGQDGPVGKFVRNLPILHRETISGCTFLFSHADVPSGNGRKGYASLRSATALAQASENYRLLMTQPTYRSSVKYDPFQREFGLVWSRDYTELDFMGDERADGPAAEQLCRDCGVDYIVAGHTAYRAGPPGGHPEQEIRVYGGRVFHIDIGLGYERNLPTPHEPRALVIEQDVVYSFSSGRPSMRHVRLSKLDVSENRLDAQPVNNNIKHIYKLPKLHLVINSDYANNEGWLSVIGQRARATFGLDFDVTIDIGNYSGIAHEHSDIGPLMSNIVNTVWKRIIYMGETSTWWWTHHDDRFHWQAEGPYGKSTGMCHASDDDDAVYQALRAYLPSGVRVIQVREVDPARPLDDQLWQPDLLARPNWPRDWQVVSEIPTTESGRLLIQVWRYGSNMPAN